MKNKSGLFTGILFLVKIYWKYRKSTLFFLLLFCLLSGALPLLSIIIPKFILDELTGPQRIQPLVIFVSVLTAGMLFGNTLINFFQTKYFLGGITVANSFHADLARNLYEADLQNVEAASFLDLKGKAERFLYADGWGFGGVLMKSATVSAQVITLAGIVSVISVLNPLMVLMFILLNLVTA
jgi:ATP-binding cassette subfamily B protein/ATP-binding cassette subfamily C protein